MLEYASEIWFHLENAVVDSIEVNRKVRTTDLMHLTEFNHHPFSLDETRQINSPHSRVFLREFLRATHHNSEQVISHPRHDVFHQVPTVRAGILIHYESNDERTF